MPLTGETQLVGELDLNSNSMCERETVLTLAAGANWQVEEQLRLRVPR